MEEEIAKLKQENKELRNKVAELLYEISKLENELADIEFMFTEKDEH